MQLLTRGGSVAAFDESIGTFASNNCTFPKSSWNLGETACAVATGTPDERRIAWVAPNGAVARFSSSFTGTAQDQYTIASTGSFAQVGTWTVETIDASGVGFATANFVVRDPANANADLSVAAFGPFQVSAGNNVTDRVEVTNNGPDDAATVAVTSSVPANATFVSEAQTSGPTFTCTTPSAGSGTGQITCTISTLPVNAVAVFSLTFNVNSGTAADTAITTAATISSTTNDPHAANNTAQTAAVVVGAANVCTLTCPGNTSTTTTTCTAVVTYADPTTSGNCGTDTPACSPPSGSTFPIGTTTVNCTTQTGGQCTFNVTVTGNDTTAPTITCPSNISTPEDPSGSGQANVPYQTPTATDNCTQGIQVFCSPPSGSSFPTGTTTVTCSASDASNNTATCSFTVTIDNTACTLTCPSNITDSTTSSTCTKVITYAAPTQSGSCGFVTCDPASGSPFPVGTTTVTCTARDTSGNTLATCSFTVTINDATTLTCPDNITTTENPPGSGSNTVFYQTPVACSGPPVSCNPPSGSSFPIGITTVNCHNTGSCSFTVNVQSSTCTMTCPANKTVSNDPNQCGAVVTFPSPTTSGNCGSDPPNCDPPSGAFFPVGTTTVTCTSARTGTQCAFTVRVNDTQPPVIGSCPANITQSNDPNQCSAVVTYTTPTANDNCPGTTVSCSPTSGSVFPKGTTTVTCTATDASSNTASCQFNVTVNDTQPPSITCPANQIFEPTCPAGKIVSFTPTVSDNCPGVTFVCSPASGSTFPIGTTTVTCTATDTSNNSSSCSFTVHVKSPAEVIQDLINRVQALINSGVLNQVNGQGLLVKLQSALSNVNSGNIPAACDNLDSFIDKVQGYISHGTLTSAQGQPLIDSAKHAQNGLGCKPVTCT